MCIMREKWGLKKVVNILVIVCILSGCTGVGKEIEGEIGGSLQNNLRSAYVVTKNSGAVESEIEGSIKERVYSIKEGLMEDERVGNAYVYIEGKTAIVGVEWVGEWGNSVVKDLRVSVRDMDSGIANVSVTNSEYLVRLIAELEESL